MDLSAPNILKGIAVVLVGAICFGTVYVPTKRSGRQNNVLFTQWIMSLGSLPVGFAIYLAAGSARLNLMSIIGGTIWTVANTTAHLVVDTLGLAVALLLWSSISTLTGWAAGRFGLFGLKQKLPEHSGLNMAGLGILLIGGACFAFVKRREGRHEHEDCSFHIPQLGIGKKNEKKKTTTTVDYGLQEVGKKEMVQLEDGMLTSIFKKAWAKWQRIISVLLALLAGFFYAASVIPVLYIQDHPERFPDEAHNSGLAFILSYCFGVFLASTAIFVFYALAKGNQPMICPTAILPSMISGGIWCCATCCLFLANDLLTQTVTYPVLITIPGCVATAWSLVYFREIKMNRRNTLLILIAFCLIFTGATFVFLSKLKL